MVKIQLDLTETQDKKVSLYKIKNNFSTKTEAIGNLIDETLSID